MNTIPRRSFNKDLVSALCALWLLPGSNAAPWSWMSHNVIRSRTSGVGLPVRNPFYSFVPGTTLTQTQIARSGTDGANIPNGLWGSSFQSYQEWGGNLILSNFASIASTPIADAVAQNDAQNEINTNGRPVLITWEWDSGGAHILVLHGFSDEGYACLMDPAYGPTINTYSWVVQGGGHTWTNTLS